MNWKSLLVSKEKISTFACDSVKELCFFFPYFRKFGVRKFCMGFPGFGFKRTDRWQGFRCQDQHRAKVSHSFVRNRISVPRSGQCPDKNSKEHPYSLPWGELETSFKHWYTSCLLNNTTAINNIREKNSQFWLVKRSAVSKKHDTEKR